jgi:hypothetical protein
LRSQQINFCVHIFDRDFGCNRTLVHHDSSGPLEARGDDWHRAKKRHERKNQPCKF